MGAISTGSVRRSEAQLWPKRPYMETYDPATSSAPPSFLAPSTSSLYSLVASVTLEAIMA